MTINCKHNNASYKVELTSADIKAIKKLTGLKHYSFKYKRATYYAFNFGNHCTLRRRYSGSALETTVATFKIS